MVATMVDNLLSEFSWRDYALCPGIAISFPSDENPFFREGQGRGGTYPTARRYCAGCPVVIDCLVNEGMRVDTVGFWGCTTSSERMLIRRLVRNGARFAHAVEVVWSEQRGKPNGANLAPPKDVWKDWR